MSERIRVEITNEMGEYTSTIAAEALSARDAVQAALDAYEEHDERLDEMESEGRR